MEVKITFTVDRPELRAGECTILHWQVDGGFQVTLNEQPVEKTGEREICPEVTSMYSLAVDVGTHMETRQVEVRVNMPGGEEPMPGTTSVTPPEDTGTGWVQLGGPPGGLGYDIRVDFSDPDTWYVTDSFAGVFKSTDRGLTWFPSNQGIIRETGATNDYVPIFCLTLDPHNPQIIWIGTFDTGRIYRSQDGGQTWEERDQGITIDYTLLSFRGFTIDPRSSDIVYAMAETTHTTPEVRCGTSHDCIGGMVYKTTDAGLHWEVIWNGGMPSSLVRYLWIDPSNPDTLYVSTGIFDRSAVGETDPYGNTDLIGGLGVLKSTDGGRTWRTLGRANGFDLLYIGSLYMHPQNPNILLAAAGHQYAINTIEFVLPTLTEVPGGIFRTTDGGEHWDKVLSSSGDMLTQNFTVVEMCDNEPDIAYAASDLGVYRSEDGGITWELTTGSSAGWGAPGMIAGIPIDAQCDPQDPNRLFINNYNGGNFLSEDGGRNFVSASDGYSGSHSIFITVDPNQPGRIFTIGRNGPWTSNDFGKIWQGILYPTVENLLTKVEGWAIAIDPSNPGHLLFGSGFMEESFDGGLTWQFRAGLNFEKYLPVGAQMTSTGFTAITFAPSNPKIVYAGTSTRECYLSHEPCQEGNGIFFSTDGGSTWQGTTDPLLWAQGVTDISVDPGDARALFAAAADGLYHSSDGALSFSRIGGLPDGQVRAVELDPSDPAHILVGSARGGIFSSTDGGTTWAPSYAGLEPNASIHSIVFDPTNPQIVYASDHLSGVYRSEDGGGTWTVINEGLTNRTVNALAISSDGKYLYVTTIGGGIFRLIVR